MRPGGVSLCVLGSLALAWSGWIPQHGKLRHARPEAAALDAPASFAPAPRAASLLVHTATGEPGVGTCLWSVPRHARAIDPKSARLLARADASGRIAWPTVGIDPERELVLAGPGQRSATLPPETDGSLAVRLAPSHRLRFRCRTAAGVPVAGVAIALGRSLATDDVFASTPGLLPGGDPRDALHVATTAVDGTAVLEGLGAMRYAFQCAHPHFALLRGIDTGTVDAPGGDVELTLAPMIGCVLEPPTPLLVRASALDLGGVRTPTSRSSRLAVAAAEQRLRAAHPGCYVHVLLQRSDNANCQGRGKALVGDEWAEFGVVLRPIADLRPEPLPLEATSRAVPPPASGELVLTGNGSAYAAACGLQAVHRGDGLECHVPIPSSGPLRLPPGEYTLDSTEPLAKVRLQRTSFTIRTGEQTEHEFRLGNARVIRVRLRTPHAVPSGRTGIELRSGDDVLGHAICLGTETVVLAPTEACELLVRAFGYAPRTARLPAGNDPATLDLDLDHAR